MRKNVFGRRLRRDKNERTALFKNLISSFVLYGSMKTTEAKAKAIKGSIDKLITKAKKGEAARRLVAPFVNPEALEKLLKDASGFSKREGGYTTMVRIGKRVADNAGMVLMRWVEREELKTPVSQRGEQNSKIVKKVAIKKKKEEKK